MRFKKTFTNLNWIIFCCLFCFHFSASAQIWHLNPLGTSYKPLVSVKYSSKVPSSSTWTTDGETFYTWDANYEIVLEELNGNYKTINTYNGNKERISLLNYTWDSTTWSPNNNTSNIYYEYNNSCIGFPTKSIGVHYNNLTNQWDSTYKTYSSYDNNCLLLEQYSEEYINSTWEKTYKYSYEYNANNQLSSFINYEYINNTWSETYLDTIFYNAQNQVDSKVTWVKVNTTKYSVNQLQHIYDSNGFLIEERKNKGSLFHQLDGWQPYQKKESINNTLGSPIQESVFIWNNTTWDNHRAFSYAYDTENDPVWDTLWSSSGNFTIKAEFFYVFPTDIEKISAPAKTLNCITANPYNGMPISCTDLNPSKTYQVKLHSVSGQLMYSTTLRGGENFTIPYHPNFSQGLYLLSINDGKEEFFVKKLMMSW